MNEFIDKANLRKRGQVSCFYAPTQLKVEQSAEMHTHTHTICNFKKVYFYLTKG